MIRPTMLFAALLIVLASLAACGDDDGDGETTAAATSDVERYCEISKQLDTAGAKEFEALEQDPNATREDFADAERALVEDNEELLAEIQEVAPEEIQDEVEALIVSTEARAGLTDAEPKASEVADAERVLRDFEKESCPSAQPAG